LSDDLEDLRESLERRSTEELVTIVSERDTEEWRPEVFDMAQSILSQRGLFPTDIAAMWQHHQEAIAAEAESSSPLPSGVDPADRVLLADNLGLFDAKKIGEALTAANIPFDMACYVPGSQETAAFALLEGKGLIDPSPAAPSEPIGPMGGQCPGCGAEVPAGSLECPECKLGLGGDPGDR
jgi:hypothetical protein